MTLKEVEKDAAAFDFFNYGMPHARKLPPKEELGEPVSFKSLSLVQKIFLLSVSSLTLIFLVYSLVQMVMLFEIAPSYTVVQLGKYKGRRTSAVAYFSAGFFVTAVSLLCTCYFTFWNFKKSSFYVHFKLENQKLRKNITPFNLISKSAMYAIALSLLMTSGFLVVARSVDVVIFEIVICLSSLVLLPFVLGYYNYKMENHTELDYCSSGTFPDSGIHGIYFVREYPNYGKK